MFAAAGVALAQTSYEAESAVLSGSARLRAFEPAAGGQMVTGVGGEGGGAVTFNSVVAPRDGLYALEIYFTLDDQRSLNVTVNGETHLELYCHATGTPKTVNHTNILIPLRAGNNVLTFDNPEEPGPDLDRIVIPADAGTSGAIAGVVRDSGGKLLAHVEVCLSGSLEIKTSTDSEGRYGFHFVPEGKYYIRPLHGEDFYQPWEARCCGFDHKCRHTRILSGVISPPSLGKNRPWIWAGGGWNTIWRPARPIFFAMGKRFSEAQLRPRGLPESVTSMDYKTEKPRAKFSTMAWAKACVGR